jgi:RNA polymerase sigma-70 factor (ECF subfamily)
MLFSECLTRSRAGDATAQGELFDRWRPLLRLQARKLLGAELSARVDPSDVVQDSLMQASQDLAKFRGTSQGEWVAWLRCIVAGQAAKTRRFHQAGRRAVRREEATAEPAMTARQPDLVAQLIDTEEAARLAAAIQALPESLREVVIRRMLDRQPLAEVAQALGLSVLAVRDLLPRAFRQLRHLLGKATGGERS